ncbi:HupE/UreJ family protein [Steroidobacter sp.]|uniref:HupE/UreJ family protein n=1 Tax=Steroidobacter sp. TaxID=1978227 RepID=UPI001A3A7556|nr:HupE/UreJ family protein [Steroidobacter sp.]MBL8270855.1 HupE/UreJ family protein [Steroidobacter sp.]
MVRAVGGLVAALLAFGALAHSVSEQAQQRMLIGGFFDAAWIGAEHMLTGYDHLLFLLGVMLFLTRFSQIVIFITAFTAGHTITLLFATMAGITANPYLVDAVIALTVTYKAIENLDGFRRWFGRPAPNLLFMVFVFGLIHGFGLSTRLQQMTLAKDPELVTKIIAFNVGVELGQIAALTAMTAVVHVWRTSRNFQLITRVTNGALIAASAVLLALQVHGYFTESVHV